MLKLLKRILAAALILIIFSYICVVAAVIIYSFKDYKGAVDAALVFGAAQWNNQPSPVLKERINHSIKLLNNGQVKYILFTGGYGKRSKYSEASASKQYAIHCGVSADSIIIENLSNTTLENIYFASKIAKKNNINSFILVSDPFHIFRCAVLANYFGLDYNVSPTKTTKITGFYRNLKFIAAEAFYIWRFFIKIYILNFDIWQ
ncbi:MAG TPA: YdcF family protein [bacterium]|nr:YdcF family protein [bacterium]HPP88868.1 YdcF family protein [bacterium]